ncbi:hypothetical protein BESB_027840 [Besnoitia besnoiti]|uniref:Polynucleotide adenylyltransferase n=1 Tax=Besnoitia besnoiti TaxID=94643 RepID=A0A2A9M076_BESBE|nr:uncharacterized protein BESB_027840 [Besnoitia besnoiti]PFH31349.1 hypothetical protein BESB_027840 [Besnoitia besnoiti]
MAAASLAIARLRDQRRRPSAARGSQSVEKGASALQLSDDAQRSSRDRKGRGPGGGGRAEERPTFKKERREEERAQRRLEQEARRQQKLEEGERKRREAEEDQARRKLEKEEKKRQAAAEHQQRQRTAAEEKARRRVQAEERMRQAAEAKARKRKAAEDELARRQAEKEERKRKGTQTKKREQDEEAFSEEDQRLLESLRRFFVIRQGCYGVSLWLQHPDVPSHALFSMNELRRFCPRLPRARVSLPHAHRQKAKKQSAQRGSVALASLARDAGAPEEPASIDRERRLLAELLQAEVPQRELLSLLRRLSSDTKGFLRLIKAEASPPAVSFALLVLVLFARLPGPRGAGGARFPSDVCLAAQRLLDALRQQLAALSPSQATLHLRVSRVLLAQRKLSVNSKQRNGLMEYFLNPGARLLAHPAVYGRRALGVSASSLGAREETLCREDHAPELAAPPSAGEGARLEEEGRLRSFARSLGFSPLALRALVEGYLQVNVCVEKEFNLRAFLYGSSASGCGIATSDVDVLVLLPKDIQQTLLFSQQRIRQRSGVDLAPWTEFDDRLSPDHWQEVDAALAALQSRHAASSSSSCGISRLSVSSTGSSACALPPVSVSPVLKKFSAVCASRLLAARLVSLLLTFPPCASQPPRASANSRGLRSAGRRAEEPIEFDPPEAAAPGAEASAAAAAPLLHCIERAVCPLLKIRLPVPRSAHPSGAESDIENEGARQRATPKRCAQTQRAPPQRDARADARQTTDQELPDSREGDEAASRLRTDEGDAALLAPVIEARLRWRRRRQRLRRFFLLLHRAPAAGARRGEPDSVLAQSSAQLHRGCEALCGHPEAADDDIRTRGGSVEESEDESGYWSDSALPASLRSLQAGAFGSCCFQSEFCRSYLPARIEATERESEASSPVGDSTRSRSLASSSLPAVPLMRWVEVDVSFNHEVVIHNTRLLRAYATCFGSQIQAFFRLVKHWAKQRQVCDAYRGQLSNYSWLLMAIFFLQHTLQEQPASPSDARPASSPAASHASAGPAFPPYPPQLADLQGSWASLPWLHNAVHDSRFLPVLPNLQQPPQCALWLRELLARGVPPPAGSWAARPGARRCSCRACSLETLRRTSCANAETTALGVPSGQDAEVAGDARGGAWRERESADAAASDAEAQEARACEQASGYVYAPEDGDAVWVGESHNVRFFHPLLGFNRRLSAAALRPRRRGVGRARAAGSPSLHGRCAGAGGRHGEHAGGDADEESAANGASCGAAGLAGGRRRGGGGEGEAAAAVRRREDADARAAPNGRPRGSTCETSVEEADARRQEGETRARCPGEEEPPPLPAPSIAWPEEDPSLTDEGYARRMLSSSGIRRKDRGASGRSPGSEKEGRLAGREPAVAIVDCVPLTDAQLRIFEAIKKRLCMQTKPHPLSICPVAPLEGATQRDSHSPPTRTAAPPQGVGADSGAAARALRRGAGGKCDEQRAAPAAEAEREAERARDAVETLPVVQKEKLDAAVRLRQTEFLSAHLLLSVHRSDAKKLANKANETCAQDPAEADESRILWGDTLSLVELMAAFFRFYALQFNSFRNIVDVRRAPLPPQAKSSFFTVPIAPAELPWAEAETKKQKAESDRASAEGARASAKAPPRQLSENLETLEVAHDGAPEACDSRPNPLSWLKGGCAARERERAEEEEGEPEGGEGELDEVEKDKEHGELAAEEGEREKDEESVSAGGNNMHPRSVDWLYRRRFIAIKDPFEALRTLGTYQTGCEPVAYELLRAAAVTASPMWAFSVPCPQAPSASVAAASVPCVVFQAGSASAAASAKGTKKAGLPPPLFEAFRADDTRGEEKSRVPPRTAPLYPKNEATRRAEGDRLSGVPNAAGGVSGNEGDGCQVRPRAIASSPSSVAAPVPGSQPDGVAKKLLTPHQRRQELRRLRFAERPRPPLPWVTHASASALLQAEECSDIAWALISKRLLRAYRHVAPCGVADSGDAQERHGQKYLPLSVQPGDCAAETAGGKWRAEAFHPLALTPADLEQHVALRAKHLFVGHEAARNAEAAGASEASQRKSKKRFEAEDASAAPGRGGSIRGGGGDRRPVRGAPNHAPSVLSPGLAPLSPSLPPARFAGLLGDMPGMQRGGGADYVPAFSGSLPRLPGGILGAGGVANDAQATRGFGGLAANSRGHRAHESARHLTQAKAGNNSSESNRERRGQDAEAVALILEHLGSIENTSE